MNVTPGWYPDPEDPANLRWWDGSSWTEHRQPLDVSPTPNDATATGADGTPVTETEDVDAPDRMESDPVRPVSEMADDGMDAPTVASAHLSGLPMAEHAETESPAEPTDPESGSPWSAVDEDAEVAPTVDEADAPSPDDDADIDPEATSVTVGATADSEIPGTPSPTDPTAVDAAVEGPPTDSGEATTIGVSAPPWASSDPTGVTAPPPGQTPPPPPGALGSGGDVPPGPPSVPGTPPPGATPAGSDPTERSKKTPVLIGVGVVVVLALVAGAAFAIFGGDEAAAYTWDGGTIADPQATLDDADEIFLDGADERNGSVSDDSRCYFVLPADEGADNPTDVADYLRCGPVLFVDDDPDEGVWLTYALDDTEDDRGDIVLAAAEQPQSRQPGELEEAEALSRPDDEVAPNGNGGIDAPRPPRAEPGLFLVDDPALEDLELESTFVTATGLTKSMTVLGVSELDRYGRDDAARRPADGERFLAFEVSPGEGDDLYGTSDEVTDRLINSAATISLDVDGEMTELIGADDDPFVFANRYLISIPESTETVDLVLEDSDLTQRISLLTLEPAPGNITVLNRLTRTQDLNATQTIPATITGGAVPNANLTVSIRSVRLLYFVRQLPDKVPSGPDKAFLAVEQFFTSPELGITEADNVGLEPGHLHLRIGDEVIQAQNIAGGDNLFVVFEVPADFETGTLVVRGTAASGDVTVDLGNPNFRTPIRIDNF